MTDRFIKFYNKHKNLSYFLLYTLFFALCALIMCSFFWVTGKSFIWAGGSGNMDGISQHYTALSYYGSYLRGVFRSLVNGNFSVPLYDTTIGAGADIVTTLHYYVIGDPLTLLSFFVPHVYTEYLYDLLILLRIWLAGLAFSAFALHLKKNNRTFTLAGSLLYAFCAYTLYAAVRHPYFANPLIYLPLILLGCEYILEKKKPYLFIAMIALAGLSNFYFFYMLCFLTLVYLLIRVFDYVKKPHMIQQIWGYVWRFGLYTAVGVMIAGVLLFPIIYTLLSSARTAGGASIDLFYLPSYYTGYLSANTSSGVLAHWSAPGYAPIGFLAVVLLWMKPKSSRTLKISFVVCNIFFMFPVFGWFLNGFANVSNRWSFAYPLLVAMIVATHLEELFSMDAKKWMILTQVCIIYTVIGLIYNRSKSYVFGMAGVILCVFVLSFLWLRCRTKRFYIQLTKSAVLGLTVLGIAGMCYTRFYSKHYVNQFLDTGAAAESIDSAQGHPLNDLEDTSYYRYEDNYLNSRSYQRNATLVNGGHSTNSYFSLNSSSWFEMLQSLGHRDILEQRQFSLDNRAILGTLANVKYYTSPIDKINGCLPFGYSKEPVMTAYLKNPLLFSYYNHKDTPELVHYGYYKNENALPFGYTYDSYISREEYNELSYTQRQQAMLQSAVLEEDSSLPKNNALTFTDTTVPFTAKYSDYITVEGNTLIITQKNQSVTLSLKGNADCETYLNLIGMKWRAFSQKELYERTGDWEYLNYKQQKEVIKKSKSFKQPNSSTLTVQMKSTKKTAAVYSEDYTYYIGAADYSIHLGYYEKAPTKITITFSQPGEYTFDDMLISQIDLQNYEEQTKALAKEHLENVEFSANRLDGTITVSQNKLLCVSLPYSAGWTAYVDGKPTEIKQTDIGFMGIELSAGDHTVTMKYCTPYLKFGALASGLGILGFAVIVIIINMKKKKKETK